MGVGGTGGDVDDVAEIGKDMNHQKEISSGSNVVERWRVK